MLIPKDARLRHRILEELMIPLRQREEQGLHVNDIAIPTKEMAKKLNVTVDYIRLISAKLLRNQELVFEDFGKGECMVAHTYTTDAFADQKYIKEGESFSISRIKDVLSIAVGLTAILSAIYTGTTAISTEIENKARIENMQTEIDSLKALMQPLSPQK